MPVASPASGWRGDDAGQGLTSDKRASRKPESGERFGAAGLPYDLLRGFDRLARSQPLWAVAGDEWWKLVQRVRAFAFDWHRAAVACNWSLLALYGLHREAPARRDAMGAAWSVATWPQHCVAAVTAAAILVQTRTEAPLHLYRQALDPAAVLAWEMARPPFRIGSRLGRTRI